MFRIELLWGAAAAALSCAVPSVAAAETLRAIGTAVAGTHSMNDPGSSSLLPGPGSLQVTAGAAASEVAVDTFFMEAIVDGIGVARYGSLAGRAHAEASSKPGSLYLAAGQVVLDLGFTDGVEVVSDTLDPGTPVTLTFRMTLDATAIQVTDGTDLDPAGTGASARLEVEVRDLDDVTVPFGQGALLINSIGNHETLRTFEFDTLVGHRLDLVVDLYVAAGVSVDFLAHDFTEGTADVLAEETAEFFYDPSGDVRLVSDSGHDYAVPEPGQAWLTLVGALALSYRRRRPGGPGRHCRGGARLAALESGRPRHQLHRDERDPSSGRVRHRQLVVAWRSSQTCFSARG
jgi:hypothetical protein